MSILKYQTPRTWFAESSRDLGALLSDHLHCERKAAENALALVRRYPHETSVIEALARLAHEETSHAVQVAVILSERGLKPRSDSPNPYTRHLFAQVRSPEPQRQLDQMLCAAFIEARSHERLGLLAEGFAATGDAELAHFYGALGNAEERHAELFLGLAARLVSTEEFAHRLDELATIEAEAIARLPASCRVH